MATGTLGSTRRKGSFTKQCWENWTDTHERMKSDFYLVLCTKLSSVWTKDAEMGPQTAKLLEENVRGKLHGIGVGNDFVNVTPKARATWAKTDEQGYIQPSASAYSKQPTAWNGNAETREKDCKPHSHTGFISKTHKESLQLRSKTPRVTHLKNSPRPQAGNSPKKMQTRPQAYERSVRCLSSTRELRIKPRGDLLLYLVITPQWSLHT